MSTEETIFIFLICNASNDSYWLLKTSMYSQIIWLVQYCYRVKVLHCNFWDVGTGVGINYSAIYRVKLIPSRRFKVHFNTEALLMSVSIPVKFYFFSLLLLKTTQERWQQQRWQQQRTLQFSLWVIDFISINKIPCHRLQYWRKTKMTWTS